MRVSYNVDTRKQQDIGGYDIRSEILDVGSSSADIENATFRAAIEQLAMKIPV